MPIDTLKAWDAARRRSELDPDNPRLRKAELEAELAHYRAVGIQVRKPSWRDRLVPGALVVLMVAIGFGVFGNAQNLADTQRDFCERSNDARVASIQEKEGTIRNLNKQIRFWNAALAASAGQPKSELTPLFLVFVDSLRDERETKEEGIDAAIAAQGEVAIEPGSPIADCG